MKPIVLSVKFTISAEKREKFKDLLIQLFNQICKEPTFINAVLHERIGNAHEIMVYETWNETLEDFLEVQMSKTYRIPFEQALTEMEVAQQPFVCTQFAQWENPQYNGLKSYCVDADLSQ